MLTLRPSAKSSTSAPPMARVDLPSTPSSAPTEPSSTRTTSSATGGSTLTAQKPRDSTHWTTRSPLNEKLLPRVPTVPRLLTAPLAQPLLLSETTLRPLLPHHPPPPQHLPPITMRRKQLPQPLLEPTMELPKLTLNSLLEHTRPRVTARAVLSVEEDSSRAGGNRFVVANSSRAVVAGSSSEAKQFLGHDWLENVKNVIFCLNDKNNNNNKPSFPFKASYKSSRTFKSYFTKMWYFSSKPASLPLELTQQATG